MTTARNIHNFFLLLSQRTRKGNADAADCSDIRGFGSSYSCASAQSVLTGRLPLPRYEDIGQDTTKKSISSRTALIQQNNFSGSFYVICIEFHLKPPLISAFIYAAH